MPNGTLLAFPSILEHTPDGGRRREKDAAPDDHLEYPRVSCTPARNYKYSPESQGVALAFAREGISDFATLVP